MTEPERAIVHDADSDRLISLPPTLIVQHEGRARELRLRVARGTIRDLPADYDLPQLANEPEPLL